MTQDARTDLVRGLLQSCYVVEHARAGLQQRWGGDFMRDYECTAQRVETLGRVLDEQGFRRTDEVVGPHTDWFESLCGTVPDEVPLGAAVLHQFGKWSDVYAAPYIGEGLADFQSLGQQHTRVDLEARFMHEDEAFLEEQPLPDGKLFVILTDVHVGSAMRDELLRAAVKEINEIGPEFVVLPGDFTEDGEPDQFAMAKEILDGLNCPYYAVLGNHDAVQRSTREPSGERFFKETFGTEAHDHVLEVGGMQVALVDTTDPTASPFPDWDISKGAIGEGVAAGVDSGALKPGQAEALAARIDPSKPVLVVQHHELHPFPGFPPVKFALREEDAEAELEALSGHKLVGIVAGHTHRSARLPVGSNGVTQLEIPALKDWPFVYSVAGVGSDGVEVVVRQVADRDLVWRFARHLPPLMRRFSYGPLSDLSAKLSFPT